LPIAHCLHLFFEELQGRLRVNKRLGHVYLRALGVVQGTFRVRRLSFARDYTDLGKLEQ
jgi:hypothetical protein